MSRLSDQFGNVKVLAGVVLIWIAVCIAAYFTTNAAEFYILAIVVGLVMGGIQSLSRSTYSKLIPQDIPDSASFFSFYDVTEKIAIVGGMFSFGLVDDITNSMRNSALVLCMKGRRISTAAYVPTRIAAAMDFIKSSRQSG